MGAGGEAAGGAGGGTGVAAASQRKAGAAGERVPLSARLTVPVGLLPMTVAVKMTGTTQRRRVGELDSVVVVEGRPTPQPSRHSPKWRGRYRACTPCH